MASISLEGEQPKGVLGRLQAREAQRAAEAARRAEAQQGSADPRESVDAFLDDFGTQRQALETAVQGLGAGAGANEADAAAAVDGLAAELAELDKEVSAAAYYLPAYDLRQATLAVGALKEQLDAARVALQPRKKFSFSRRGAAKPVCEQPAAAASGGVRAGAPTAAAAAGSVPAAAAGDSQQLGDSGAPSTSGRTISGLSGQVVVEAREAVAGLDVTLSDLQDCTIFLLAPLAALFIHRLQRCRVYAGAVAGAAFMEDVRGCTLALACRQVRAHATEDSSLYLRAASNPIIEFSHGVRFAPYALAYPGVEEDLAQQGLAEDNGKWAEVQDFGWLRQTPSPNWEILPEEQRQPPPEVPQSGSSAGGS